MRKTDRQTSIEMTAIVKNRLSSNQDDWLARLDLEFQRRHGRTALVKNHHFGPLSVQKPFYPEGSEHPHVYVIHPPGGIVSGDRLDLSILLQSDSQALITTPGAGRFYRARSKNSLQKQSVELILDKETKLEWFPLETIVFDGANAELETKISLKEGSIFMGWEICCLGMPASQQNFSNGSFFQKYIISIDNVPAFVDVLDLRDGLGEMLTGKAGMQSKTVVGFLLMGPVAENFEEELDTLRCHVADNYSAKSFSLSKVGQFLIWRYLGDSADAAKKMFTYFWTVMRPRILSRQACLPRIWFT